VALGAKLLIAVAKAVADFVFDSPALRSEAARSVADSMNGGLYAALARGRIDTGRLWRALAEVPLPRAADGRLVLAVDVTCWLLPDAHTSPERILCHTYGRGKDVATARGPVRARLRITAIRDPRSAIRDPRRHGVPAFPLRLLAHSRRTERARCATGSERHNDQ
jgi:hypothetical protein